MNLTPPSDEELQQAIREFEEENIIVFPEILGLDKLAFARILVDAMAKFFGDFPAEGYYPLCTFTDKGIEIQNASTITLMEDDSGEPFLNVKVFRDDGSLMFNGYVNIDRYLVYFLNISLQYLVSAKERDELMADEKFKENLVDTTYSVMCMAMRRMPKWIEIMLDSFENKIELIWAKQLYEEIKDDYSSSGLDFPKIDLNISRQKSIRAVEARIREFLQDDTGIDRHLLNIKKRNLATTFRNTYSHWDCMQKLQLDGKEWRRYIQAGDMSDVTEDLIEEFVSGKQIGDIAIEHAARRAELHNNVNLIKRNQELRSNGVKCSGYSRSKLFEFKREGEALIKEDEVQSSAKTN
jgi:hypothetical protein